MYNVCMRVLWDPAKAISNLKKHGVRFSDAEMVLSDTQALTREDESAFGEQRHVSLGLDSLGRVLVVVFTYREDHIRLISARQATRRERGSYEGSDHEERV